jgi:branched-chain amino acid transport system substrate-binding protein
MLKALVTSNNHGFLFQIAPKGSAFGNQQVEFLKYLNDQYKMGITKAAILYVNNPYGQATQKGIVELAQKAGLEIVLNSAYPDNITDASPLVSKIEQSGAQVVFLVSYITDAGLILTALRSAESQPSSSAAALDSSGHRSASRWATRSTASSASRRGTSIPGT